jgi:4-amino-4-deoxy-L-arabinose transferase-like glycosyltransferase
MLEASLVLPALGLTYLVHGRAGLRRRLGHLVLGGVAVLVSAGWWVLLVELWPTGRRPFIGGSPRNSIVELTFGYNGLGRLTGSTGTTASSGGLGATNLARIGRTDLGGEVMWLVPAAVVLGFLAGQLSRRHPLRPTLRASLLLWATWLIVATATFAGMAGIFHSYYTVVLAPGIAALVAIGSWLAWERRHQPWVRRRLSLAVLSTAALATGTLLAVGGDLRWTSGPILAAGLASALLLHPASGPSKIGTSIGVAAVVACLAGPALFVTATVRLPHVGSGPMAGPGHGASTTALVASSTGQLSGTGSFEAERPLTPRVVSTIASDAEHYRWAAAAMGARSASAYQLAVDEPVLAVGGYKGTDPMPTLSQFQEMVRAGQVHWLITGGAEGPAGHAIAAWVATRCPLQVIDGFSIFDLSAMASG